jgi:NADH:ubiquinone oxidoreductase subunit B-like Fe-S oxidoreductase
VKNGAASIVPVDLFIPGWPPHPLTILDGLRRLLSRLGKDPPIHFLHQVTKNAKPVKRPKTPAGITRGGAARDTDRHGATCIVHF